MNYRVLITLNIFLSAVMVLLGWKVYYVWHSKPRPPQALVNEDKQVNPLVKLERYIEHRKPKGNYDVIAEKNLFSSDRRGMEKEEGSLGPESGIVLCGTFVWGEHKAALLEMPEDKGEEKLKEIKVGDSISGYRVADILEDKVVLESEEGKTFVLNLEKGEKKRKHIRTSTPKRSEDTGARSKKVPRRKTPVRSKR